MLNPDLVTEFDALLPGQSTLNGANRRTALNVAMGVGYAAATSPVMAQTAIRNSADGMATGESMYDVAGFSVPIYHAAPLGKTKLPVVLVLHEAFGVHEYVADTCRRFAKAGYLAIAPELFARQGDPSSFGEIAKLMAEVVSKVPDEQVMGDLDGAVKWAGQNGGNLKKVGITGFCWGGRLVGTASALTPKHPVDLAADLKAPVLGLNGGQDGGIALSTINQMKDQLVEAGAKGSAAARGSEFVVYKDAPHASTQTIDQATEKTLQKTDLPRPWPGSKRTAWRDHKRETFESSRLVADMLTSEIENQFTNCYRLRCYISGFPRLSSSKAE